MKALEPETILRLIDVLMRALGTKALCMLALVMTFTLYVWSMLKGNWLGFVIATVFAIVVFLPALFVSWYGSKRDEEA